MHMCVFVVMDACTKKTTSQLCAGLQGVAAGAVVAVSFGCQCCCGKYERICEVVCACTHAVAVPLPSGLLPQ